MSIDRISELEVLGLRCWFFPLTERSWCPSPDEITYQTAIIRDERGSVPDATPDDEFDDGTDFEESLEDICADIGTGMIQRAVMDIQQLNAIFANDDTAMSEGYSQRYQSDRKRAAVNAVNALNWILQSQPSLYGISFEEACSLANVRDTEFVREEILQQITLCKGAKVALLRAYKALGDSGVCC